MLKKWLWMYRDEYNDHYLLVEVLHTKLQWRVTILQEWSISSPPRRQCFFGQFVSDWSIFIVSSNLSTLEAGIVMDLMSLWYLMSTACQIFGLMSVERLPWTDYMDIFNNFVCSLTPLDKTTNFTPCNAVYYLSLKWDSTRYLCVVDHCSTLPSEIHLFLPGAGLSMSMLLISNICLRENGMVDTINWWNYLSIRLAIMFWAIKSSWSAPHQTQKNPCWNTR